MAKTRHIEDALAELEAEQNQNQETQTQTSTEDTQVEETQTEDKPAEEKPAEETETQVEDKPSEETEKQPPVQKDEVGELLENTNSVIRKRLEKQASKYKEDLAARDAKYDDLLKQFNELKKTVAPKQELTRDQFTTDEDFVAALTQKQIDAYVAKQAELKAQKDAEEAKVREAQEAEEAGIRQRQDRFMANVDYCYSNPEEKKAFMGTIKTYLGKGLGDLLDACPVASDYLLTSPRGPKVLNRLLTDKESFVKVFDPRGITPMEQFYALKEMEKEIYGAPSVTMEQPAEEHVEQPAKKPLPKYGKPGAQGGGRSADVFTDPKARRDEVRKLLGF